MSGIGDLGARSRGVWTRSAALRVLTRGQVAGSVGRREWQVVWPGTYADAGIRLDTEQRVIAAVLASGGENQFRPRERDAAGRVRPWRLGAVAAGRTAARIHRIPLVDDDDPATGSTEWLLDDVVV